MDDTWFIVMMIGSLPLFGLSLRLNFSGPRMLGLQAALLAASLASIAYGLQTLDDLRQRYDAIRSPDNFVSVVFASRTLLPGTLITAADVFTVGTERRYVTPGAAVELDTVLRRRVRQTVYNDEVVHTDRLNDELWRWPAKIPTGLRALPVRDPRDVLAATKGLTPLPDPRTFDLLATRSGQQPCTLATAVPMVGGPQVHAVALVKPDLAVRILETDWEDLQVRPLGDPNPPPPRCPL